MTHRQRHGLSAKSSSLNVSIVAVLVPAHHCYSNPWICACGWSLELFFNPVHYLFQCTHWIPCHCGLLSSLGCSYPCCVDAGWTHRCSPLSVRIHWMKNSNLISDHFVRDKITRVVAPIFLIVVLCLGNQGILLCPQCVPMEMGSNTFECTNQHSV